VNIAELKESKFLRKEDAGAGILVTIREVHQANVAKEGAPEEMKWVMSFDETDKPLVLNSTNGQIIAQITGSPESDNWTGVKVVLYHDPNVSFGGKLVGGVRIRAPRKQPVPVTGKRPPAMPTPKAAPAAPVADNPDADPVDLAAEGGPDGLPF
jgi:hypothetical protein